MRHKHAFGIAAAVLLLLLSSLPAAAAANLYITSPTEGATVQGTVTISLAGLPQGVPYGLQFEIAEGFNATGYWREPLLTPLIPADGSSMNSTPPSSASFLWQIDGLSSGPYTLRVTAWNKTDNTVLMQGRVNVNLVAVDLSPEVKLQVAPEVSGRVPVLLEMADSDFASWRLEAVDPAGKYLQVSAGSKSGSVQAYWDAGSLPDGTYKLIVTAWDTAGHHKTVETKVLLRNPPPTLTTTVQNVDADQVGVQFSYSAVAPGTASLALADAAGMPVASGTNRIAAGTNQVAIVPVNLTGAKAGAYTAKLTLQDDAGRKVSGQFTVNVMSPLQRPELAELPQYSGEAVDLHWTAEVAGITGFEVTRTGADGLRVLATPGLPPSREEVRFTDHPLVEGQYVYKVAALRADGRRAESIGRTTVVDWTAPSLDLLSVSPMDGQGINLHWAVTDAGTGVAGYQVLLLDGGQQQVLANLDGAKAQYSQSLAAGDHTAMLVATDRAGNTLRSQPFEFSVVPGAVSLMGQGRFLSTDVPGFIEGDRTWVPLRLFSEALGYQVLWDGERQTASILDVATSRLVVAGVGDPVLHILDQQGDRQVALPAAPRNISGRVIVPLRALLEALGAQVEWHGDTRTVELISDPAASHATPDQGRE